MKKLKMTTRRWIVAIGLYAVALWSSMTLGRTLPIRPHLRPTLNVPGMYDYAACPRTPFLAKFLRLFLGRPWPGDYICPDHPEQPFIEDPSHFNPKWWEPQRTARLNGGTPNLTLQRPPPAATALPRTNVAWAGGSAKV